MPSNPLTPSRYGAAPRSRFASFVLALGITLLLFAALVAMGTYDAPGGGAGSRLVAMNISGERAASRASASPKARPRSTSPTAASPRIAVVPPVVLPSQNKLQLPEGFIQLSRADMASGDIGRMRSPAGGSGSGQSAGGGGGSGEGEGPGGARLYNAEWVREPTDAELAGYLPKTRMPGQWAVIACRTIDHFHVEDCREMDESPRGSGVARAMRQAAWQFLVRPPRLEGKPIIGAWVRIRFDFTKTKGKGEEAG